LWYVSYQYMLSMFYFSALHVLKVVVTMLLYISVLLYAIEM